MIADSLLHGVSQALTTSVKTVQDRISKLCASKCSLEDSHHRVLQVFARAQARDEIAVQIRVHAFPMSRDGFESNRFT